MGWVNLPGRGEGSRGGQGINRVGLGTRSKCTGWDGFIYHGEAGSPKVDEPTMVCPMSSGYSDGGQVSHVF